MSDNLIIIIASILNFLNSTLFIHILLVLIITHQVLLFFTKDISHIKVLKDFADPKEIKLSDLNHIPLINVIIPAWKEGKLFEDCLLSITKLDYPNLKVIISAGGNEETIQIANSFKKFKNFIILKQKPGGKMKALNDCLNHISEGIIYSIDADVILNNEILLRMIYPLVNENQYVTAGSVRPLKIQENIDIVKYILINRNTYFRIKFSRIGRVEISGPNSCFKYEVIEKIGNFFDDKLFLASDRFRGPLIYSKGFKIYWLTDYRGKIFTFFPDTLKIYFLQEFRWRMNSLTNPYMKKKVRVYIKFLISFLLSIYLLSSPFFTFFNINLALIGLIMLLSKYLKKLRKIVFFKRTTNKEFYEKFGLLFFLKLVFFIFIDEILTVYLGFKLLISRKKQPKITIK
ncbi:MAG: glycosyltransferase family 2 protein [Candidatus Lokiarchaeota archaeon]|nr:glycosyltransferase family 2 protein [Candidatus Lokiarchaeota archaeon]